MRRYLSVLFFPMTVLILSGCATAARIPAERPALKWGPIEPGEVTWDQAMAICKERGDRLPTARDYVNVLLSQGILVLEKSEVQGNAPEGYYPVDSVHEDGSTDFFYMNHEGYRRPQRLEKFHRLWTASMPPQFRMAAHVFYDQWGGGGGKKEEHLKNFKNSFQCVRD